MLNFGAKLAERLVGVAVDVFARLAGRACWEGWFVLLLLYWLVEVDRLSGARPVGLAWRADWAYWY